MLLACMSLEEHCMLHHHNFFSHFDKIIASVTASDQVLKNYNLLSLHASLYF